MRKLIILSIISFKLIANDTLSLSLATLSGTSNYTVWQESSALKSKLIFPYTASLLHLGYAKKISDKTIISFNYATKINSKDKKGEDYDWQHDNLTVYSFSKNRLNSYQSFLLSSSYKHDILTYVFSLSYRHMAFYWRDTSQIDYIKNEQMLVSDKSVSYQQKEFFLGFSPSYNYKNKKISFSLMPSIYYGANLTKDNHLKRGFYTKGQYKAFAYGMRVQAAYKFLKSTKIRLFYKNFYFNSANAQLKYKSDEGFQFQSLPSHTSHREHTVGICIAYIL